MITLQEVRIEEVFDASSQRVERFAPVNTPSQLPERIRFENMDLSDEVRAGLDALGYELATPVQANVFAPAMEGHDLMVQSKTGSGKTTAFGLPVIEKINTDEKTVDPQALILCPTRELAIQVAEEMAELGDPKGVRVLPIYGGAPMGGQLRSLKAGCDVVVGTPGRILDHIRRRTLRLVHVHSAVLDEADEMLSMGFWEDVTRILDHTPDGRQTFLFSATLPDEIRKTAQAYMRDPRQIDISRDELTVEGIDNYYYEADERLPKPRNLLYILEVEQPENAIIFCNTRDDANVVAAFLRRQGLHALAMSGELAQRDRERIMKRMKSGELRYLVATDIAARGIDISDLSHVVLYSLPGFSEVYLHRVGRTGRIGKHGTAISLVGGRDEMTFTELKRLYNIQFEKRTLPPLEEIERLQASRVAAELVKEAREVEITSFLKLAGHLVKTEDGTEVVAYLLKLYFAKIEEERARVPVPETEEDDRRRKKKKRRRDRDDEPEAVADVPDDDDDDRGRRKRKRRSRSDSEPTLPAVDADAIRLFVNRGTSDGYDEHKIRQLMLDVTETSAPEAVRRIQLRRSHAFVEAETELAEAALKAVARGLEREDKPIAIERARTRG